MHTDTTATDAPASPPEVGACGFCGQPGTVRFLSPRSDVPHVVSCRRPACIDLALWPDTKDRHR